MTRVIAISGGSGSGKSTLASALLDAVGPSAVEVLPLDAYYHDLAHLRLAERARVNFDHPDALDFMLMGEHIGALKQGHSIETPIYDFSTHTRIAETKTLTPKALVIIEGILVLHAPAIRAWTDYGVFVECEEGVRYARRSQRDIVERGRTPDDIKRQFFTQVVPMHSDFVEPSSVHADMIIKDAEHGLRDADVDSFVELCVRLKAGV